MFSIQYYKYVGQNGIHFGSFISPISKKELSKFNEMLPSNFEHKQRHDTVKFAIVIKE